MELFDNIKNCNRNAHELRRAKKREKVECSTIAVLAGSLVGLCIRHFSTKKAEAKIIAKRLSAAKQALLGNNEKPIDTTGAEVPTTETDFTEVNDMSEEVSNGD